MATEQPSRAELEPRVLGLWIPGPALRAVPE
jgi:hypothetical protein